MADQGCTQDVAIFFRCQLYSPYKFIFYLNFVETRYGQGYLNWKVGCLVTNAQTQGPGHDIKIRHGLPAHQYSVSECGPSSRGMYIGKFLYTMPASRYTGNSSSRSL